jgi:hypothetical protein
MSVKIEVLGILLGLLLLPLTTVSAQSCNPAAVNYIVRREGQRHQRKTKDYSSATSRNNRKWKHRSRRSIFTSDGVTYYWPESVDWDRKEGVDIGVCNAATCTLSLPRVDLEYHGMKMTVVFDISIERHQMIDD